MTTVRTYPYRRPGDGQVIAAPWHLERDGARQLAPDALHDWDPATDLELVREVKVDLQAMLHDCLLDVDSDLRIAVTWHSTGTSMRGRGIARALGGTSNQIVELALRVPGAELGLELVLTTLVVLGRDTVRRRAAAPWRAGTTLWSDEKVVQLEGAAPRFPVELLDFAEHSWLPTDASWYLDWDPEDLDTPVLGGPRLLLNARNPSIRRACAMTADDVAGAAILEAIRYSVVHSMLTTALALQDSFTPDRTFEKGTIGRAIERLLTHLFSDSPIEVTRQMAAQQPDRFAAELQSRLRLFIPRGAT